MRFTVCIPSIRPDTLAHAIASIRRQTFEDWELIVITQGDSDELAHVIDIAADGDGRIRQLHSPRRGLSIARNTGLDAASGEIVALTDDDCEAAPDWLFVLDAYFRDPGVGAVAGSLVAPPPRRRLSSCPEVIASELVYQPSETQTESPSGWEFAGGNLAIRRAVCAQVGPFDEQLGAGARFEAAEDTDYLLRLERLGTRMVTTPRSIVHHTYGHRYGWRSVYRHKRNYARGNGALAAKLTMLDDDRGRRWMDESGSEAGRRVRAKELKGIPAALFRHWHQRRAFTACLDSCRIEQPDNALRAVLTPGD